MSIKSYRDLEVFKKSLEVLGRVHRICGGFPGYEVCELGSQMRRASKSIALNICEGYGRKRSVKDFKYFLSNAMGSANEMVTCLEICKILDYSGVEECDDLIGIYEEIGRMLNGLIQKWQ